MSASVSRRGYPSDVSDRQWTEIAGLLAELSSGAPHRTIDLREVVNALSYRWQTGCVWRMLPHDFPPWTTVYWYVRRWRRDGTLRGIREVLLRRDRRRRGTVAAAADEAVTQPDRRHRSDRPAGLTRGRADLAGESGTANGANVGGAARSVRVVGALQEQALEVAVPAEHLLQLRERAGQEDARGTVRLAEAFGDFLAREPFEVSQAEGFAGVIGQGGKCLEHMVFLLLAREGTAGGRHAGGEQVGNPATVFAADRTIDADLPVGGPFLGTEVAAVGVDDAAFGLLAEPAERLQRREVGPFETIEGADGQLLEDVVRARPSAAGRRSSVSR